MGVLFSLVTRRQRHCLNDLSYAIAFPFPLSYFWISHPSVYSTANARSWDGESVVFDSVITRVRLLKMATIVVFSEMSPSLCMFH